MQDQLVAVMDLIEHFGVAMDFGEQLPRCHRHANLRNGETGSSRRQQSTPERLQATRSDCGNEYGFGKLIVDSSLQSEELVRGKPVDSVEDAQDGLPPGSDVDEDAFDAPSLFGPCRVRQVDYVQQQVRLTDLLECRAKRRNEVVRQLANESDGVGQKYRVRVVEAHLPCERIERRKEPVLDAHGIRPR